MVPLASLKMRGKLYFSENDTRTHLTRAFSDNPRYNTPDSLKVIKLAEEKGVACYNVTKDNADASVSVLREVLRDAGVHIYCENDAVIYANESFVFLHTCSDGAYKINMKSDVTLTDVFTGEEFDGSVERKKRAELYTPNK